MYCKNCANELNQNAAVCEKCGAPVGAGNNYCGNCAAAMPQNSAFCPACGAPAQQYNAMGQRKSKLAAGLLAILVGALGIHNFYLGFTGKAVAQLLITVLSCGILSVVSFVWALVEGIFILTGESPYDANGVLLRDF